MVLPYCKESYNEFEMKHIEVNYRSYCFGKEMSQCVFVSPMTGDHPCVTHHLSPRPHLQVCGSKSNIMTCVLDVCVCVCVMRCEVWESGIGFAIENFSSIVSIRGNTLVF